jgi:hypothetical protein
MATSVGLRRPLPVNNPDPFITHRGKGIVVPPLPLLPPPHDGDGDDNDDDVDDNDDVEDDDDDYDDNKKISQ